MANLRPVVLTLLIVVLSAASAASAIAQGSGATPEVVATGPSPVEFVWEIGGGSEPFAMPIDVSIDPEGNPWVLDMAHHQFQIFSPDGEFLESWGSMGEDDGEFRFYEGSINLDPEFGGEVAFDREGNAYVVDMANQRIQKFAPDHTFLTAWGEEGSQDGQFSRPFSVAVDAADNIYVADFRLNNVQQFTTCGAFVRTVVESGDSLEELHEPGGLAIDRDGAIWVGDWVSHKLLKYAPDGTWLAAIGGFGRGEGRFSTPSIWAGADGLLYVIDVGNDRIQILDAEGNFLATFGSEGSAPGQFVIPAAVVTDDAGNIYVADLGNNRVQKFRLVQPLADATPTS
jgi:DNA-binding beta-propeller fold protein YncE